MLLNKIFIMTMVITLKLVIIFMGDNFYANHNLVILDGNKVVFGDNVFISPNCGFYTAGHPLDATSRNQGIEYAKPITIGMMFGLGEMLLSYLVLALVIIV